tara:strand:+ start:706 stop:1137 length:432 start_codon:yes stop_codon:yes gene_type:complete
MKILVIHGPNLNLLGQREPDHYGEQTIDSINGLLQAEATQLAVDLRIEQSNHEGQIVELIQNESPNFAGLIINPAAFTHTSIAIRDAISATGIATVEVHLSNIYQREEFRHHSYIAPVSIGQISGFKQQSYRLALHALVDYLK